jgi:hypothetical protein
MDEIAAISVFAMGFFLYFIPTVVAAGRKHRNAGAIVVLNVLLGWTFIGWVIAFVWSLTYQPPEQPTINR